MNRLLYYPKTTFYVRETMAKIVNNEFQVNVMNKSGKFWRWPQKEDKIFYNSTNIVKCIKPPTNCWIT